MVDIPSFGPRSPLVRAAQTGSFGTSLERNPSFARSWLARAAQTGIAGLLGAAMLASAACGGGTAATLDDETYIQVMAKLTHIRSAYEDTARSALARAAVLEEFGVSGAQLLDFAREHGSDPWRMEELWIVIHEEVRRLDSASLGDPPGGQAPGGEAGR